MDRKMRTELQGHHKHFGELAASLTELQRFVGAALNEFMEEGRPSDDWMTEYEAKLYQFMVEFAAKFADAPGKEDDVSSETPGPRSEIRTETQTDSDQTQN